VTWVAEPRSHLGWTGCAGTGCEVRLLVTEEYADRGRCEGCGPVKVEIIEGGTMTWPEIKPRTLEVPASVHPEPLVRARDAREVEIPSAARSLRKVAEANGWSVRPTYALGWVLGAKGKTAALTHTLAVRMTEKGLDEGVVSVRMVVAVWNVKEPDQGLLKLADRGVAEIPVPVAGWKFDMAYGWGGGQPHHKLSAAALKQTIKEA
jgi:hypothetical protein